MSTTPLAELARTSREFLRALAVAVERHPQDPEVHAIVIRVGTELGRGALSFQETSTAAREGLRRRAARCSCPVCEEIATEGAARELFPMCGRCRVLRCTATNGRCGPPRSGGSPWAG